MISVPLRSTKDNKIASFLSGSHEWILFVFLLIMPFHTFLTSYYFPTVLGVSKNLLAPWREGVVLLLFVYVLFYIIKKRLWYNISLWNLSILAFVGFGLGMVIAENFSYISIYGFRNYYFPFAFLFAAFLLPIKRPELLIKGALMGAVLATLFGFIQLMLGARFLLQFGYGKNNFLGGAFYIVGGEFQRLVGTFSSPNEFGLYLSIVVLLGIYYYGVTKKKLLLLFIAFECVALIYTFSRSSWLAFFLGALYLVSKMKIVKLKKFKWRKLPKKYYLLSIPAVGLIGYLLYGLSKKIIDYIYKTFTMKDPSSVGHFTSITEGLRKAIEKPIGYGLGRSGPKGETLGLPLNNTESSYLLLSFEVGIVGLGLFLLVMFFTIRKFKENKESKEINTAMTIALLTGFFFLPQIQSLDITYFYWLMVGLLLNRDFSIPHQWGIKK